MSTRSAEVSGEPGNNACPAPIRGFAPSSGSAHAGVAGEASRAGRHVGERPTTSVEGRAAELTVHLSSEGATVRETGEGVMFESLEQSRNGVIACDGAGEAPHGRLRIERSTRSTARGGPRPARALASLAAGRGLRIPMSGEMGTNMHIASGWEAQESHGHGHTGNGVAVQRTLQRSKASRSSGCAARNGEGAGSDGDIADAAGEGNALEGVASARRARPPVLRGTAEHKTR